MHWEPRVNLTTAQKFRLGAFVASGLAILLITLGVLTGLRLWEPRSTYRARFKESVSGLERSAPVKYQGLRVGRVESLTIAHDDPRAIEVILSLEPTVVLYEGTEAQLDNSGLTGLKTINLVAGDPRRPKLPPGTLLPTGPSLFDRITDNASAIMGDIKIVTDRITHWINEENRARLESLLRNLDVFVGHLDKIMSESRTPMHEVLTQVAKTAQSVGEAANEATITLKGVRSSVQNVEESFVTTMDVVRRPIAEIDPLEVAETVHSVRNVAAALDKRISSEETGRAFTAMAATVDRVNLLVQDVDLAVRSGREDFTATLSYLRQAAEDLREFSRILAQNPSVLVRGREESE